jgi:hypothetical protein
MVLKLILEKYVDWIQLAQDRVQCRALVNIAIILWIPRKWKNYCTGCRTVSCSVNSCAMTLVRFFVSLTGVVDAPRDVFEISNYTVGQCPVARAVSSSEHSLPVSHFAFTAVGDLGTLR